MGERKDTRKYTFTVEGWTERWYLEWLRDQINKCQEAAYTVSIDPKVQQSPIKFAKTVNPLAVPNAVHICDYESNDEDHIRKFQDILKQLKMANSLKGRSFKYSLGYCNFTFELWMILHKMDFGGAVAHRSRYLDPINKAYGTDFEDLDKYKHEKNFKSCLAKLTLDDVRAAIRRSKRIMESNRQNGLREKEYMGFRYYSENPSLTIWECVELILKDCKLL
ncbi:MAG: RloB domain-containing protein [Faecousia sp.]